MAGKGIVLDVLANVRQFLAGTKTAADALEEVGDSLDDVVREGDKAGDKLERTFRELAQDASTTTRRIADDGRRDFRRLGDAGREAGGELRQNLGESLASFRGDLADLPQLAQDTLGGLAGAGALGGIAGLAVTAAGAAGLGLVTAELQKQQEEADRVRERISAAYAGAAQDGRDFLTEAEKFSAALDILFSEDNKGVREQAAKDAENLGINLQDVVLALAGDEDALAVVLERANEKRREAVERQGDGQALTETELAMRQQELGVWDDIITRAETQKELQDDLKERAEQSKDIQDELNLKESQGHQAAMRGFDERGRALQSYADRMAGIPNPKFVPDIDDSGLSDLERRVANLNDRTITLRVRGGGMTDDARWLLQ